MENLEPLNYIMALIGYCTLGDHSIKYITKYSIYLGPLK